MSDAISETTDLLQQLIRNECVNDGQPESGNEGRSADLLRSVLERPGIDVQTFVARPGRESLVARIEGRDRTAPSLCLMGHTDVVPVNPNGWTRDPFGGELVDGEIWGRGAVDMLHLTASMAVAMRRLAEAGFRPRGTLIYLAVADEEAAGVWGAQHLLEHERDAVAADYVITETGGIPVSGNGPDPDVGVKLPVAVGEKGCFWAVVTVLGTPGHGSQPYLTDNALVKAAEVVRRLAEFEVPAELSDTWRRFVAGLDLPDDLREPLLDPDRIDSVLDSLPIGMARQFHACTHTTLSTNLVRGGQKINTIPDEVELEIDVRGLAGWGHADVEAMLADAIGTDLLGTVTIEVRSPDPATESPVDTPLWDTLTRASGAIHRGSTIIPTLMVGATDARHYRRVGSTAYGFGGFSRRMTFEDFATMFHGNDERVDVESLGLSVTLWEAVARDLLDPVGE